MSRKPIPRKLHEEQEEYTATVVGLCLACGKQVKGGYYGMWQDGGTCNKTCEAVHEAKPKYPPTNLE